MNKWQIAGKAVTSNENLYHLQNLKPFYSYPSAMDAHIRILHSSEGQPTHSRRVCHVQL